MYFCNIEDLKGRRWDTNYWRRDWLVTIEQINYMKLPVYEIEDLAYVAIGQSGKRTFIKEKEVQYLIVSNLLNSGLDNKRRIRYVGEGSFNDPPRSRIKDLDILMAISGGGSIGKLTIALDIDYTANISQDMALIRLEENQFSTLIFLQSKWGQAQILRLESGTGVTHLNQDEVKKIKIPIFPSELEIWCKEEWLKAYELHKKFVETRDNTYLEQVDKTRIRIIEQFERKINTYIRNYS